MLVVEAAKIVQLSLFLPMSFPEVVLKYGLAGFANKSERLSKTKTATVRHASRGLFALAGLVVVLKCYRRIIFNKTHKYVYNACEAALMVIHHQHILVIPAEIVSPSGEQFFVALLFVTRRKLSLSIRPFIHTVRKTPRLIEV